MLSKIGSFVLGLFSSLPYVLGYVGRIFTSSVFFFRDGKTARKILIMQLLFTFIEALPLVCFFSASIGTAIYLLGYSFLQGIGQTKLIYTMQILIVVRELGPLLVAFMVTARSATAIATELAGMVTSHQIESYVSFGIDPITQLVVPRFLGVTASLFFLNLYFSLCGLLSPILIGQIVNPLATSDYIEGIFKALTVKTILVSMLKSIVFGIIISITATYYGFSVERASTEIPVAGIQAVGKSFFGIIIADVIIIVLCLI